MAKVVDITEKLAFDENPKLKIKDKELEVNADAETVLRIMGVLSTPAGDTPKAVMEMYELIFGEEERKTISELRLQFEDFQTVVFAAVNLITGNDEEQGE